MEKTTIQLPKTTLEKLKFHKKYQRESYAEVIEDLMSQVEEETLSEDEINEIQEALEDVKSGRKKSIEQIAKELGIALE